MTPWEIHLIRERQMLRRTRCRWLLLPAIVVVAVLWLWLLFGCAGCSTPPIDVAADVAVASPTVGDVASPVASLPTSQQATAGPVSGERNIVVPINVNGSAWGIVALAGVLAVVLWLAKRWKADSQAGKAIAQGIDRLGPTPARNAVLASIVKAADAAGVRGKVTRLAERAGARARRR